MRDRPVMLHAALALLVFVVGLIDLIGLTYAPSVSREPDFWQCSLSPWAP